MAEIALGSDYPVTDESCKAATGKTFGEWAAELSASEALANKRRDAIVEITETTGRTAEGVWWATTIWVEYERQLGRVQKDGRPEGYHLCSTKTINAPVEKVQAALAAELDNITRIRDGKDIRATWTTPGCEPTEVEVLLAPAGAKVGVNVNHKRIPNRDEADALRRYWAERLVAVKASVEA
ncbi:MAG TPA: hypothetical protein VK934_03390 [Fimbriimonas sp.]|nr:hypothetical protein [Fimbriimonas sp.]